MTYFFLDTEWADPLAKQLVSLALVSADGLYEFYAEMDPLPQTPTDFVRYVVYPLLDRGATAMHSPDFTKALRHFLSSVAEPYVLADHPNDLALLQYAVAGFDLAEAQAQACGPIPRPVYCRMLKDGITQLVLEDYFDAHPNAKQRRHHALVDAQALRMAWLALTGRVAAPWSRALAMQNGVRSTPPLEAG